MKKSSKLFLGAWLALAAALVMLFYAPHAAPDYAKAENWAYFGIGEGKNADVFLICPTVDMNDEDSMSLTDEKTKQNFVGALNMERGIYEPCARLYAPFYRQASMRAYAKPEAEREPIFKKAYGDVSAAFAHYLKHENGGRPLILAGFSQGADMCLRLLQDHFRNEKLQSQLVAVYALGWPLTKALTESCPWIAPARGETDTGVVVAFDCEAPEVSETIITPANNSAFTINPLNWRTDATPATLHDTITVAVSPEYHVLVVTGYSGSEYAPYRDFINVGDIHSCEPWLYSDCLARNIAVRAWAWRNSKQNKATFHVKQL